MLNSNKQPQKKINDLKLVKQLSYNEIIEYLDARWSIETDKTLKRFKAIDLALGQIAKVTPSILVTGTNGKSLTADFATKLLREEGLNVGTLTSPHILNYNERIAINNEILSNKKFSDIANLVINTIEQAQINASSSEILTAMAISAFVETGVDVAVLETHELGSWDPTTLCNPKIVAITRVTSDKLTADSPEFIEFVDQIGNIASKDTFVISADQSKLNLQTIQAQALKNGAKWAMPIRKLAALPYPFEQLHGRCAALAERTVQIFVENFITNNAIIVSKSLLIRPKGQRGRPSLAAKRQSELNPRRTIDQFWKECTTSLPGRFQILEKEKPSILLDTASNIDALTNTLLGVRLINYKKNLKGLTLIIGCDNNEIHHPEFLKQLRYFFKKVSGQVIFCPVKGTKDNSGSKEKFDIEGLTNDVKNIKVKAQSANDFIEAFDLAKKSVDERYGMIIITGSKNIVSEYWSNKGIKKL